MTMTAPPSARPNARRLAAAAGTVVAIAFIGARFVSGAHETLSRTRDNACLGLQPDPLPAVLGDGRAPPDFQLPDATGKTVSLKSQLGHPVLLNFWATWCPPCVEEVPSLEDLARRI